MAVGPEERAGKALKAESSGLVTLSDVESGMDGGRTAERLRPDMTAGDAEQAADAFGALLPPVLARLGTDPRLPVWMARAAMAAAAATGVTLWEGWWYGLTAAALVAIADTVYRARTTAAVPAAVRVNSAQRRIRLRMLPLRLAGYRALHSRALHSRALHSRALPAGDSVIHHLVIGPAGVFMISSQRWDRRLPVRAAGAGLLYHGPFSQHRLLDQVRRQAAEASALLAAELGYQVSVRAAVAIYGPGVPWIVARLREVDVFAGRRVRRYLRRQARARRGGRLDLVRVREILEAAERVLPPGRLPRPFMIPVRLTPISRCSRWDHGIPAAVAP
jgi:hypothetical protein